MQAKHKYMGLFLIFVLICSLISGCAEKIDNITYINSVYTDTIPQLFPGYTVAADNAPSLNLLNHGAVIEAYDAQAAGALSSSLAKYWYPLTLETVVIAVDRDKADISVATWSDLRNSDVSVGINNTAPMNRLIAAAICFGLEGGDFSLTSAIQLLEPIAKTNNLKPNGAEAPIQICFDSDAAAKKKNGENIEIIIPAEGTLTYTRGLLSNNPLTLPDNYEQILIESGLRLTDSRCNETIYPPPEQYTPALLLTPNSTLQTPNSQPLTPNSQLLTHINIITQSWLRVFRRDILHTRLYSSADSLEHIVFASIFIIITAIWVGSLMQRSRQKNIRRVILFTGILLIVWILMRILKYQIDDETTFARYLWYGFYLFEACLPLVLLRIAALIGIGSENKRAPKWLMGITAINLMLVGFVMTNDLHNLMFKLDLSKPGWSRTGNYGYGILFYIVIAILLTELTAGIILMIVKSRHNPRRSGVVFPFIFIAALVTYIAGYAAHIPVFSDSDVTIVYSVFTLLFLEVCVQTGRLPVNIRYRELFKNAGLKLQIINSGGNSVFLTDDAEPLSLELWDTIRNSEVPIQTDENTLLLKNEISGGYAVWQEDVSAINKLRAEIKAANNVLEKSNRLLLRQGQAKEQKERIKAREKIYNAIEKDIAANQERLEEILRAIPRDETERGLFIGTTAVLVCYIKRRFNFLFLDMSGKNRLSLGDTMIYLDELAEIAGMTGIEYTSVHDSKGELDIRHAALFYDFFYSALTWAADNKQNKIVLQIATENNRIELKLIMFIESLKYELPEKTAADITAAGGHFEKLDLEDMAMLKLSFYH